LERGISFSLSPRKDSEVVSQGKEIKMDLHSLRGLELLHYLILGFKEAKYDLSSIIGTFYFLLREPFIEKKAF